MTAAGSALTMPTNYDQKRLIGWVRTDASSNITAFIHSGDYFRLTGDVYLEVNDNTITGDTFETAAFTTPPLSLTHISAIYTSTGTDTYTNLNVKTKGAADAGFLESFAFLELTSAMKGLGVTAMVLTNASSQIEYAAREASGVVTIRISVHGCQMLTRSNP